MNTFYVIKDLRDNSYVNIGDDFHDPVMNSIRDAYEFDSEQDAIEYLENSYTFDAIICSDGIEHLSKKDGLYLLALIIQKSKSSVIFTPYGDYMVDENSTHPDTHKSGWTEKDFEKMGYSCIIFPNFHPELNKGAIFAYKIN